MPLTRLLVVLVLYVPRLNSLLFVKLNGIVAYQIVAILIKLPKKRILKYNHPDLALIHCLDYHQPSFALKYRPLKIKRIFCIHLKYCYAAQPIAQSISRSSNTISVKMHFNLCPATDAAAQIANPITI